MKATKTEHSFSLTGIFASLLFALTLSAHAAPITDGEIIDVIRTANNAEIAAAEVANTKGSSPKVREFAATMLKEHKNNNAQADSLTKKTSLVFEANDKSANLKSDADSKLSELQKAPSTSRAFDRTYVEQQASMHKALLDDLKNNLIPNAQNAELKAFLKETKAHVEHHLMEANKLLSAL